MTTPTAQITVLEEFRRIRQRPKTVVDIDRYRSHRRPGCRHLVYRGERPEDPCRICRPKPSSDGDDAA